MRALLRPFGWLAIVSVLGCGGGDAGGDVDGGGASVDADQDARNTSRDSSTATRDVAVSTGDACERIQISSEPIPTNVLVVLDSSGSMYRPEHGIDRWGPAVTAVKNVTEALESRIRFGLALFPSDDFCGPGEVAVSPEVAAAGAIDTALSGDPAEMTGGGTPTATTMDVAEDALSGLEGDRFVLLITDGAPACNESITEAECQCVAAQQYCDADARNCLDDDRTVEAIGALADGSIRTYVIGYDTSDWSDVLDRMAVAGATGRDTYIPVTDGAALESAIAEVSRSVVPCTYELADPPGDIRYVSVKVDGSTVDHVSVHDDGSGWELRDDTTVELLGDSCARVQDGAEHDVDITVECELVLI